MTLESSSSIENYTNSASSGDNPSRAISFDLLKKEMDSYFSSMQDELDKLKGQLGNEELNMGSESWDF